MITILCSPKPFIDEIGWIQLNALRSWRAIDPTIDILIFGTSKGTAQASIEVNAHHIPDIECSNSGAPSFNDMTKYASQNGIFDLQVYVNCDILLNKSIMEAMQSAVQHFSQFLCVGERVDLIEAAIVDVQQYDWGSKLKSLTDLGKLTAHGPTGLDYFGFIRGTWKDVPPVFMGRAMCDHALLHFCLKKHIPIIDATNAVVAVHQFHDYHHVRGGIQEVFSGEDRVFMMKRHGLNHSLPTLADSGWMFIEKNSIVPRKQHILRNIEMAFRYRYGLPRISLGFRFLQYLIAKQVVIPQKRNVKMLLDAWHL